MALKFVAICMLFLLAGFHAFVVQGIGWLEMASKLDQNRNFADRLATAVFESKACEICHCAQNLLQHNSGEQEKAPNTSLLKIELHELKQFLVERSDAELECSRNWLDRADRLASLCAEGPTSPPPRSVS